MPKRRSRRVKSKPTLTWRRLFIYFIPVFLGAVFIINQVNGGNVLGISDSKLFNFSNEAKPSGTPKPPKPSCNRVISFSANTICDSSSGEKSNNAFTTYTYTCEDGTSGSVEQKEGKCAPVAKAYELARKACSRKCITPKPTRAEPTKSESNL